MDSPGPQPPAVPTRVRRAVRVRGIVQGVGFRPFVFGLAERLILDGFVRNDAVGVEIEIEGPPDTLDAFERMLVTDAPPLARIDHVDSRVLPPVGEAGFRIKVSDDGAQRSTFVSPDVAACPECLAEMRDPSDRRYRYPFTNCTNCGPRFTITRTVPYDRPNTTMAPFPMCADCEAEYHDPHDRRFHAQPVACPACGPQLALTRPDGNPIGGDPITEAARLLLAGEVLAVKGLGGYHLACDATSADAVSTLRGRKHREEKPFAVMVSGAREAGTLCDVDEVAEALLGSRRAPIVLLPRRADSGIAPSVAPGNRFLGLLLPYTPVHHLLLNAAGRPLVMTSGNTSDEPIACRDADAREHLGPLADAFLVHDREIHVRCDDSVVRPWRGQEYPIRRSRGYAPEPLQIKPAATRHILATGAELKHTFCLAKDEAAFLSHHIGDLENWETMRSFIEGVEHYARVFDVVPEMVAYDPHPEYLSTKWVLEQVAGEGAPVSGVDLCGLPAVAVQHHHAHIASCLADNGWAEPVIGLALDGTGWGTDGTIWGFELLIADLVSFERVGHLRTVPLPGGAAAVREPWRMAAVYLAEAFGDQLPDLEVVRRTADRRGPILDMASRRINSPVASSAGRLFDAVAALCGIRDHVTYEGQAAIELEQVADPGAEGRFPFPINDVGGVLVFDGVALVAACAEALRDGADPPHVATAFHEAVVDGLVAGCRVVRDRTGIKTVALSGGTWQNRLLTDRTAARLESDGFVVLHHRRVPPNDGGIALGQAVVAAARARVLGSAEW